MGGNSGARSSCSRQGLLNVSDFGVDQTVLVYVVLISLASGLIFGVAPAFWARHRDPAESLKSGGRSAAPGGRVKRWGDMLVVSEVALALLMTVGAGLLVRSFWRVRHVDPGFDSHGVLAVQVGLNQAYDTSTKILGFQTQLVERARAIPGVTNVAMTTSLPLKGPAVHERLHRVRPARRRLRHRGLESHGVARLLRDAARSAQAWAHLHDRRPREQRAGARDQRGVGDLVLQGPGSDRPAHRVRQGADAEDDVVYDRRYRRRTSTWTRSTSRRGRRRSTH